MVKPEPLSAIKEKIDKILDDYPTEALMRRDKTELLARIDAVMETAHG